MWPSGLRRCVKAAVRKGVGSNPTAVILLPRHGGNRLANSVRQVVAGWPSGLSSVTARLAQSVERQALNLMVVGSIPTVGAFFHLVQKTRDFVQNALATLSKQNLHQPGIEPGSHRWQR